MSKSRALRHLGCSDELIAHAIHVVAIHRAGALVALRPGASPTRDITGQLPAFSGASISSQPSWVEPLAPEWPSWQQIFASVSRMDEIDDALPRRFVLRRIHAGAAGRDAAFRTDAGHLDADEAGAALGALAVMHEMPIGRAAVDRLVLRHRRNDDAVFQPHVAQLEWREHRPPHYVVAGAGEPLKPGFRAFEPVLVAQPQVLVADALRARQQRIVELHRIEMQIALDILEPLHRISRRRLQAQHFGAAGILVFCERRLHGRLAVQIVRHDDRALHGELGAGADGEMRRGGGVAHQHDVSVRPLLAQHARENSAMPSRANALAFDIRRWPPRYLAKMRSQARQFSSWLMAPKPNFSQVSSRAFDDESRGVGIELVGVRPDPAVLGLFEDESEGVVEFLIGAEPDEFVLAHVDGRLEMVARIRRASWNSSPSAATTRSYVFGKLRGAGDFGLKTQYRRRVRAARCCSSMSSFLRAMPEKPWPLDTIR